MMNLQQSGKVDKGWGFEIVFANNGSYCGKLLVFERAGAKTSLVFHKEKRKSWFVNAGKFRVRYIDIASGDMKEVVLEEGKTVDFAELSPHQVEALAPNSIIFEVGTADYVEDRFRLAPGDTQTKQSEQ
jgi:hypothetical protein